MNSHSQCWGCWHWAVTSTWPVHQYYNLPIYCNPLHTYNVMYYIVCTMKLKVNKYFKSPEASQKQSEFLTIHYNCLYSTMTMYLKFIQVHLESIPCHSSSTSSGSTPSCSSSSSSSVLSAQSIQLECKVFNGANGCQIQCTKVSRKELREVYRDIKLKVTKFDTVPPCTPIFFKVLANKPCYVYIINQGSSGNLTTLIPNECDKNNRLLRPDHFIQFPSPNADYEFELDQNCGTETIIVLAYSDALGDPKQAEKDCEDILKSGEEKDVLRDIKVHKKTSQQFLCRGCIEIQFTVKWIYYEYHCSCNQ